MKVTTVRVGEIAQQIRGVTFGKADATRQPQPGYVPVVRAGNIQDGSLDFSDLVYVPKHRVSTKQRLKPDDIVITASSGSLATIGKAARVTGSQFEGTFGAFLKVLRPGVEIHPAYFSQYFQTSLYRRTVASLAAGANINNLKNEHLDELEIRLPSLEEQRRIATILDHADALRAKRRQVLAHLDALTQSIFHDMFGEPDAAVKTVRFGEVAGLSGGRNLVADDASAVSTYRVLKISAVTSGEFKPWESKPLPDGYEPPPAHFVRTGDLLMSRANTAELVGAVAYVHQTPPNLVLPDKVWRFDWRSDSSVPVFYHSLFGTRSVRRRISQLASGTGGSMKNVSKAKLETMLLPSMSPDQQHRFAAVAADVSAQRSMILQAAAAGEELFVSLQSRAFKGEL